MHVFDVVVPGTVDWSREVTCMPLPGDRYLHLSSTSWPFPALPISSTINNLIVHSFIKAGSVTDSVCAWRIRHLASNKYNLMRAWTKLQEMKHWWVNSVDSEIRRCWGKQNKEVLDKYKPALFYCMQMLSFLQIEGLWQPYIQQVYRHHFSNSVCLLCGSVSHIKQVCVTNW